MNKTMMSILIGSLTIGTLAHAENTIPTDAELTGQRVYHHMDNMVGFMEKNGVNNFEFPGLADHTWDVITPALDHIYAKAMLDVTNGPVEVTVPPRDAGRYASFHLIDAEHFAAYHEVTPAEGGTYLLVRSGADYDIPEGKYIDTIDVNDDLIFAFIRVQTFEYRDNGVADEWRKQLVIDNKAPISDIALPDRQNVQSVIQFADQISDGWPQTHDNMQTIIADKAFDQTRLSDVREYVHNLGSSGLVVNNLSGFEHPGHADDLGDEKRRSLLTHLGHLGFPAEHAYYEMIPMTPEGQKLNGSEDFVLTMPHQQAVGKFWSITRYSDETRLPLDPATIKGSDRQVWAGGNTTPDSNGNITITFSSDDPQNGTYWMPVVDGEDYYFIARYYLPQEGLAGNTVQNIIYKGSPLETLMTPKATFNYGN
ncbi:DUF1254 domain-containing protein [Vibrio methylphosphonaticus]|uniref:DUF1254 domain-containing protein n=1 Tax=Vibrio methylphosphonaticus TaxID=2946866 RepID=UPI00202AAE66|nr:DUF1254 domain-containing protein [Vibrio methylphosphonaticus]MCL9773772.1 DUF1254 domain-containing protein [Vibrio methylphosphonaticus]